eukprot:EG_transcript_3752
MGKNSNNLLAMDLKFPSFDLETESPKFAGHPTGPWQAPGEAYVNRSSKLQHCHFNSFFAAAHGLRRSLHQSTPVEEVLRVVGAGLRYLARARLWLRVLRAFRAEGCVRRVPRLLGPKVRRQHAACTRQWLAAWTAADADPPGVGSGARERAALGTSGRGLPPPGTPTSAPRVSLPVTPALRGQVLWELYWLLRAQHQLRLKRYWAAWMKLMARRAALRWHRVDAVPGGPVSAALDFWDGEAQSLPAVNAALFVLALQEPRFNYDVGSSLPLKELRRIAEAHLYPVWDPRLPRTLQRATPTILAFLASPLCTEPDWLLERCQRPVPLIPEFSPKLLTDRRSQSVPHILDTEAMPLSRPPNPHTLRRHTLHDSRLFKRGSLPPALPPTGLPPRRASLAPLPATVPIPGRRGSVPAEDLWRLAPAGLRVDPLRTAAMETLLLHSDRRGPPRPRRERSASLPRLVTIDDKTALSQSQRAGRGS